MNNAPTARDTGAFADGKVEDRPVSGWCSLHNPAELGRDAAFENRAQAFVQRMGCTPEEGGAIVSRAGRLLGIEHHTPDQAHSPNS